MYSFCIQCCEIREGINFFFKTFVRSFVCCRCCFVLGVLMDNSQFLSNGSFGTIEEYWRKTDKCSLGTSGMRKRSRSLNQKDTIVKL